MERFNYDMDEPRGSQRSLALVLNMHLPRARLEGFG